jgi:zinc ribbon protein
MYCVNCGAKNSPEATFCQTCGKQLPTTDQDESTILTIPPALSSPYEHTPSTTTPSPASDPVFAPPPPPGIPERASSSGLPPALPTQRPKRRRGYFIALVLIVLLVLGAVGAYVYLNRSTPEKTLTTYYGALISGDYQTAYDQLSTASKGKITEPAFVQFWQALGGVKAWSTTAVQEQGSTATAALTVTLGNGQTRPASLALIDENGVWKIENETIR